MAVSSAIFGVLGYNLPDNTKQWIYDRYLNAQSISLPVSAFTGNKGRKISPLVFEDGKAELYVGNGKSYECLAPEPREVLIAKYIPWHSWELEISCGEKRKNYAIKLKV